MGTYLQRVSGRPVLWKATLPGSNRLAQFLSEYCAKWLTSRAAVQEGQSGFKKESFKTFGNQQENPRNSRVRKNLAEREGFEPPIPVKVCPLSRRIVSTTHAPLRAKRKESRVVYKKPPFRRPHLSYQNSRTSRCATSACTRAGVKPALNVWGRRFSGRRGQRLDVSELGEDSVLVVIGLAGDHAAAVVKVPESRRIGI